jgi:hypothetical protein
MAYRKNCGCKILQHAATNQIKVRDTSVILMKVAKPTISQNTHTAQQGNRTNEHA